LKQSLVFRNTGSLIGKDFATAWALLRDDDTHLFTGIEHKFGAALRASDANVF